MSDKKRVVIARKLLPAGETLFDDFEVVSGGLDSDRDTLLKLVPGAVAIIADPTVPIDPEVLDRAGDKLEVVANFAVGFDNVDLAACRDRGVTVTNTPDVLTNATAELAAALTFAAARGVTSSEAGLRAGEWRGWDPGASLGLELSGATIGVVGMGRIGQRYAELMRGLGGDFLYTSREPKEQVEVMLGARKVELEQLLRESDVVSLHLPATPQTIHLISTDALTMMKPTAILINTGRGPVVDSDALASALETGEIGGAGLDVYEGEPDVPQSLLDAPNTALTPHIGSATTRARDDMARLVARNVIAVLEGRPALTPVA